MKYKKTVNFEREFVIEAKNATAANEKLEDMVRKIEFDSDTRADCYYDFEDEDINCPKCKGDGEINEEICDLCKGETSVPFGIVYEPK